MAALDWSTVEGFKSIKRIERLALEPINIVIGSNGSVETQVVFATQSTLLLDHFHPEDVLVADRVDGGTQLTRLDRGALEEWLQDYSLGQLWEKNHFGGRPGGSGAERG